MLKGRNSKEFFLSFVQSSLHKFFTIYFSCQLKFRALTNCLPLVLSFMMMKMGEGKKERKTEKMKCLHKTFFLSLFCYYVYVLGIDFEKQAEKREKFFFYNHESFKRARYDLKLSETLANKQ